VTEDVFIPLKEPTYAEAVTTLAELSQWPRKDVIAAPSLAAWQSAAYVQVCRRKIEQGKP
jgi:hypothetical protein